MAQYQPAKRRNLAYPKQMYGQYPKQPDWQKLEAQGRTYPLSPFNDQKRTMRVPRRRVKRPSGRSNTYGQGML